MKEWKYVGIVALLLFLLHNLTKSTSFGLTDTQQGILALISIVSLAVVAKVIFPLPPDPPQVITRTVVVEREKEDPPITPEARLRYGGNPDAGGGK